MIFAFPIKQINQKKRYTELRKVNQSIKLIKNFNYCDVKKKMTKAI